MAEYQLTHTGAEIDAAIEKANNANDLVFTDASAATWVADPTCAEQGFGFRAAVALSGVTSAMTPAVVFNAGDAVCGNFAPVAESYDGGIYLYAREAPTGELMIPVVRVMKGV